MAIQRTTVQKIAKRRGPNHPTEPSHPVFFIPRERMKARALLQRLRITVPPTTLPVDCSGGATVQCPMDGNDQYGDCGEAMCAHGDNLMTFGNGKRTQSSFDTGALVNQYLAISGGDNGMDESMVVGSSGVWKVGLAGNAQAVVQDALDIPGDAATLQYFIDQFWAVYMAWSVPDAFLDQFTTGSSFLSPMQPDPNNGHYTPLSDLDSKGNMRLWTWGGWCWASQSFVDSVQPTYFAVFSARQFDPATGYDAHGRHITTQAAAWTAAGGAAIPQAVIAAFPPASGPVNPPPPAAAQIVVSQDVPPGSYDLITANQKKAIHGLLEQIAAALPSDSVAVVPTELRAALAARHLSFGTLFAIITILLAFIDKGDFSPAALTQLLNAIMALLGSGG